jgi:hypothetical protein
MPGGSVAIGTPAAPMSSSGQRLFAADGHKRYLVPAIWPPQFGLLLCAIDVYASLAYDLSVIFLETPVFTRQIRELVEDDQYRELQSVLVARPDAGDLIPRSGGLRKIRVAVSGRGKRGGARVIYYWVVAKDQIYMLLAYAKNVQDDLTEEQLKTLRALIRQEFG